jgi:hypothetical protein
MVRQETSTAQKLFVGPSEGMLLLSLPDDVLVRIAALVDDPIALRASCRSLRRSAPALQSVRLERRLADRRCPDVCVVAECGSPTFTNISWLCRSAEGSARERHVGALPYCRAHAYVCMLHVSAGDVLVGTDDRSQLPMCVVALG